MKTHCTKGHAFVTGSYRIAYNGQVICKECIRENNRRKSAINHEIRRQADEAAGYIPPQKAQK